MTSAETRERLRKAGFSPDQATSIVDTLEDWQQAHAVTKDYLDARLSDVRREIAEVKAELKGWFLTTLTAALSVQTTIILGAVYFLLNYLPKR